MLPFVVAYQPFALIVGATAADLGAPVAGWAGSWLVYAGSAQLAAMRLARSDGALVAVVTALLVNLRLAVYSASLAQRWRGQPRWFRVVAAPLIIDPTWAAAMAEVDGSTDGRAERRFFLAAGSVLGAGWSAGIAAGALLGATLHGLDLRIVVPLCLIGLLGDSLRDRRSRGCLLAAAVIAVAGTNLPAGTGLLAAVVGGVGVFAAQGGRAET